MLQKLHIQNYAIIDELVISFSPNLNIITGETGAGKSILMGALNLILGQRADISTLQDKEKKCIVEGFFTIHDNAAVNAFLVKNELDVDREILLRREIAANGKSRSFINDTPVNLSQLKELAVLLVDLHQQFDTFELGSESFQREVMDALADNGNLLNQLKDVFGDYSASKKKLQELQEQQFNANKELDYHLFLYNELEELSLQENELENLEAEFKLLSNAESIKQQLGIIFFEMSGSEQPILQQLRALNQKLPPLQSFHPDINGLFERMNSSLIELQDISDELERIDEGIQHDAQRIETVNDRLSMGYKLYKKHSVNETSQLLAIQKGLADKLSVGVNISSAIAVLEKKTEELLHSATSLAKKISENRAKHAIPFAEKVNGLLAQVGMPNAQLKISMEPATLSSFGSDEINFLFDANKSNRFEPLHKVASGGELSRLMLSVKSLVAKKLQLPTLIFDEIDTGISGEAARQVGVIMKDLSGAHQLIAITHQPQIAAKASAHYFVYKQVVNERITTSIRLLNQEERILTIAQMMSGEKPTSAALESAREMVVNP
jgi:DNA repair protein RecN (Recombination protein N)